MSGAVGTEDVTTAAEMARSHGVDPKRFRAALRRASLRWHSHSERWEVRIGSPEHRDMERILATFALAANVAPAVEQVRSRPPSAARSSSDEAWIIDLCDAVLGKKAIRQHRFPFLLGDAGPSGRRVLLPVDAFYPELGWRSNITSDSTADACASSMIVQPFRAFRAVNRDVVMTTIGEPCSLYMAARWWCSTTRNSSTPVLGAFFAQNEIEKSSPRGCAIM